MNNDVIAALAPDATGSSGRGKGIERSGHAVLPLIAVVYPDPPRDERWVYGIRRVDRNGRVIDKAVIAALGWHPGTRLHATTHEGTVRLTVCQTGKNRITNDRDLRLAARTRRTLSITAGDQVLLAADTQHAALLLLPLRAVDRLIGDVVDEHRAEAGQS